MHYQSFIAAAALASLFPAALADGDKGKATIQNKCGYDVYITSIADSADAKTKTVKSGSSFSEDFKENGNGGGISIKISEDKAQKSVTQLEYTLSGEKVFYDLSNIDGNPFKDGGVTVTPSDSSCPKVNCEGGLEKCKEAYHQPKDDHATHGCSASTDINMVLCAGGGGGGAKSKSKRQARHPHAAPVKA